MGDVKPTEQMRKVSLNLGTGDGGNLSQDSPRISRQLRDVATLRAPREGGAGASGICCPLRCLIGDPMHSCVYIKKLIFFFAYSFFLVNVP